MMLLVFFHAGHAQQRQLSVSTPNAAAESTVLLENLVGPGFFLQRRRQRQTKKLVWRPGGRCNSWIATGLKLTIRAPVSGTHCSAIAGTTYGGDFPAPFLYVARRLCRPTFVPMMETAHLRQYDHSPRLRRLHWSTTRSVLLQRKMRPALVIVIHERLDVPVERSLVKHDHMVQTLAANRSDHALDVGSLPG